MYNQSNLKPLSDFVFDGLADEAYDVAVETSPSSFSNHADTVPSVPSVLRRSVRVWKPPERLMYTHN